MKIKVLFIIATLLIILTGCNPSNEKVTITLIGENSSNLDAISKMTDAFEKQSGYKIDIKSFSFEEAYNKANIDFANGTGLYDIVMQYNFSLSPFVRNNYVYNVDDLVSQYKINTDFEKDLFQSAWKEVGYYYKNPQNPSEGSVKVGYPFATNTMLLAYNSKMFEDKTNKQAYKEKYGKELSVPTNWVDFKNVAEFFTTADTKGICMHGASGGWLYYEWANYLFGQGGKVMDKERGWESTATSEIYINSDDAINSTNFMMSLKPFNAGNFITTDGNEQIRIMQEGNTAMALMWSDYIYYLLYDEAGNYNDMYNAAPVPGDKSMLAGGAFFINKQSSHPKEAMEFISFLMTKENQAIMMKNGLCSSMKSAYDEPIAKELVYSNALKTSLERGVYMAEAGPDADLISSKIGDYVQKIWNGDLGAKEALETAQDEIVSERKVIFEELK